MSDFQTFVASRLRETDYLDARTETFLREATVRQLRELSRHPVDFLDGSFIFQTVGGQDNYGAGHAGFPADLYGWAARPYVTSSSDPIDIQHFLDGPMDIEEIRRRGFSGSGSSLYPDIFAWYNRFMWLAPRPQGVQTVQGDYRRDGLRDSTTGVLISTTSTTATNGWFDAGEQALRCAVMLEYHETISKDGLSIGLYRDQLFGSSDGQRPGALKTLRQDRDAKRQGLVQTGDTMFNHDRGRGSVKSAWRWA